MYSSSLVALIALVPYFVLAAVPPVHLSRRAADAQTALALDSTQVQSNAGKTGQEAGAEAGQVASATSTNNFINFCLTQNVPITNGLQTKTGSCNPTIMGRILSTDKLVSSKFVFPKNTEIIEPNKSFTIQMAIKNMVTGNFVNPQTNYYAAPCQVDGSGTLIGHSHVVIEKLSSLDQTTVTDPNVFAFFKGLNGVANNGVLTADVTGGLAAGSYRLASINACANHQPVLGAVAQHGSFDDAVYFTVAAGSATGNASGAAASSAVAAAVTTAAATKTTSTKATSTKVKNNNNAAATSAAATGGASTGTAGNLQTFAGQLGGTAAPAITGPGSDGRFTVNGNSFANISAAKQRSCDIQQNKCSDAANGSGNKGSLTVSACQAQQAQCLSAA